MADVALQTATDTMSGTASSVAHAVAPPTGAPKVPSGPARGPVTSTAPGIADSGSGVLPSPGPAAVDGADSASGGAAAPLQHPTAAASRRAQRNHGSSRSA